MNNTIKISVALASAAFAGAATAQVTVHSNNPGAGDLFNNLGGSNQGQAIAGSSWFYNNTRQNGSVGISTAHARSGNGSAFFAGAADPSKADIELLSGGTNFGGNNFATSALGTLGGLTSLRYEWYRDSSSTARADLHPVVRILVDADGNLATTGDRGSIIFERAYNGGGVTTNAWVFEDIFAGPTGNMWSVGAAMSFAQLGYGITLAGWQAGAGTIGASSAVLGLSLGIGSGWGGTFNGAVDNVTVGFVGAAPVTYNFEVIPAPGAAAVLGMGAIFAGRRRRN